MGKKKNKKNYNHDADLIPQEIRDGIDQILEFVDVFNTFAIPASESEDVVKKSTSYIKKSIKKFKNEGDLSIFSDEYLESLGIM